MFPTAYKAVSAAVSSVDPSGTLQSITLEDESTVVINLPWTQVSLLYLNPDTYPSCSAFIACPDSNLDAKLLPVAARLQDKAPLTLALAEVGLYSAERQVLGKGQTTEAAWPENIHPQSFHVCLHALHIPGKLAPSCMACFLKNRPLTYHVCMQSPNNSQHVGRNIAHCIE